jgi:hypothetical protein
MRAKAVGLLLCLSALLGASGEAVGASGDAPRHDVYAATARCWSVPPGRIAGTPVTSIMRDPDDAIDGALTRFDDLGLVCIGQIEVEVTYIP